MPKSKVPISLQSYAFQLRKQLLIGAPIQTLLEYHRNHQQILGNLKASIGKKQLPYSDRFAWKFIQKVNILSPKFTLKEDFSHFEPEMSTKRAPKGKPIKDEAMGAHQNLRFYVENVQAIWFPHMKTAPKICWLKRFTTRKLAHYAFGRDEIAFSLIFDLPDTPPELLNYLAYHELLHRELGVRTQNGRRYAHTPEFKQREDRFPDSSKMDQKITDYILTH